MLTRDMGSSQGSRLGEKGAIWFCPLMMTAYAVPELMLRLLREMAADPLGNMEALNAFNMSDSAGKQFHHVEFLVDAGHAEWRSREKQIGRSTDDGYDFLSAVSSEDLFDKFKTLFDGGFSYVDSAHKVVELARSISPEI